MAYALQYTADVGIFVCCRCGTQIALVANLERRLRKDHETFYCPLGHGQSFTGKSDAEKLREAQEQLSRERSAKWAAEAAQRRAEQKAARLLKRAKAGVCPKCNRSFSALQRHMATKHPECA